MNAEPSPNWNLTRRKSNLRTRAVILQAIRTFFTNEGYLEVDTPLLIPAPAPEPHIDAIPAGQGFLHTSPELCMKRLLAAGYERIFQICRCWRADERGGRHLPEFTMLEWYRAEVDYLDLMRECEELVRSVAVAAGNGMTIRYRDTVIDLTTEWERLTVREAFHRYTASSMEEALANDTFDLLMVEAIEPRLGSRRPTFLHDYPAQHSALARLSASDPTVAERFELYVGGLELANAFSELTDPVEQRHRFACAAADRADRKRTAYPLPEPFLNELAAMPTAAGIALGIDRLVMVLLDAATIDEVVAFTPEEL
ncbi:EF-P lysine aminoacylase EpmA [Geobacter argillaceus]|uniref:EF-P lysine aminoacylase EpmA n=1 Tax=Geobacter argillaceus TaxID=345631 RepID=UPI0011AB0742|nr:EF-P lysine aminoacylase EpmA [Geobacter argillaceus]